ncbi:MAG: FAD/NAD(P)-binding oxidoreductase [Pseudomonadota bacterium]
MSGKVIIVGGSHAAVACADNLRKLDYDGPIAIHSREPHLPYQRPPLSKGYMSGAVSMDRLLLRPQQWYDDAQIDLHLSSDVTAIDRTAKQVVTGTGERHDFDALVLATGADPRMLSASAGGALPNVFLMRDLGDADALKAVMTPGKKVVIIGGGYIGLEAAAEAAKTGLDVTVVEASSRILQRVACRETADSFRALHAAHGVRIIEDTQITGIVEGDDAKASSVTLDNGDALACDLVIVGIGVSPNTELAVAAGLDVAVGILVDEFGRTDDPAIYACGDCTVLPMNRMPTRLESVQNAHDQAMIVAHNIAGQETAYDPEPWFWSDQYDMKLQIAGLNRGYDTVVTRPGKREGSVSHFYFQGETFLAADCLNDGATYMMCRKILAQDLALTPAMAADEAFDLRGFANGGR